MKEKLENTHWDILIIGGGATGIGAAIDAASRGYKTLLVEKEDYGKGTSSKSTKLIHGGVRYLQQGNFSLVLEALKERAILKRNAPHIVHDLKFVVPTYDWWESPFYGIGLKLYDWLAGKEGFGDSEFLSKEETINYIPTVSQKGLRGGVIYHDGQFDDTRLLINMMQTAKEQGATVLNYTEFIDFTKNLAGLIDGAIIKDTNTLKTYAIQAKSVINATGVFSDTIRQQDHKTTPKIMTSSQGVHIVLDKSFLPSNTAIMIPETEDGRVLFAVPWHDKIIIGTTDTPVSKYSYEPLPKDKEVDFLLTHTAKYLTKNPTKKDVKSVFVGLRPLVKNGNAEDTAEISREHVIEVSKSGLISIAGGKWTTYRKMAEDVVDKATMVAVIPFIKSETEFLNIHGHSKQKPEINPLGIYGTDAKLIRKLAEEKPELKEKIHPNYPFIKAQIVWAILKEDAKTIEDILARRIRLLFLDAKASIESVEVVAAILQEQLIKSEDWKKQQITSFKKLAQQYLLN
ncbi:glycerol-3-phosphate dehydrogenase [Wenyingzhuangia heitensis]|uniref:Glycerol-3-phosphate dehydrogenase n=1 Tax=Wenyingzhuangia heitensis TaxID=1487859 RepID=A0ABX0UDL3_9FLAO|nr:glycerol-3-phosphate dehydrogenase/oxidase [Wenyingzhuangia heitensis]NIJ45980.1 glycerol-3-phosphate dehydrogenase [Wenyingzhuangia heitensis]